MKEYVFLDSQWYTDLLDLIRIFAIFFQQTFSVVNQPVLKVQGKIK